MAQLRASLNPEAVSLLSLGRPLSTREVAHLFGVHPKTVGRWETLGLIHAIRTPGGHRRYPVPELNRFIDADGSDPGDADGTPA